MSICNTLMHYTSHAVSSSLPSRILTWHRNETRSLAIADLILYSAGE